MISRGGTSLHRGKGKSKQIAWLGLADTTELARGADAGTAIRMEESLTSKMEERLTSGTRPGLADSTELARETDAGTAIRMEESLTSKMKWKSRGRRRTESCVQYAAIREYLRTMPEKRLPRGARIRARYVIAVYSNTLRLRCVKAIAGSHALSQAARR